jgi:hypothetical protein
MTRTRFVLDPSDSTLLLKRDWTPSETATYIAAQTSAANTRAALLAAIGDRVVALHASAATATAFATAETARAAVVAGLPLAQVTIQAIRDELALIHTDLAQISASQGLGQTSIADLAQVVSDTLK